MHEYFFLPLQPIVSFLFVYGFWSFSFFYTLFIFLQSLQNTLFPFGLNIILPGLLFPDLQFFLILLHNLIRCAVSIHHRLAKKDRLTVQDLYGEKLMLIKRDWSHYVDLLRDELWKNHPQIQIIDFKFYNMEVFNQCENNNCILMAVPKWQYVHPLLKILPVEWNYTIPYGLLHAPEPSPVAAKFLRAVEKAVRT